MNPVEIYLKAYLEQLEAQLGDLPPERRAEILNETQAHLEAMILARRADGMDDGDAWRSARSAFGDAEQIGRDLAREWKRAPRVETVGTPLTRREKLRMFARPMLLGIAVFMLATLVMQDQRIATYWRGALFAAFTVGCFGFGIWRWRRAGGKWTPAHVFLNLLCVLQLLWANLHLTFGTQWRGTIWDKISIYQSFVLVVLFTLALSWLKRESQGTTPSLPWRQMPLYAQNPIAAEETYRLSPKIGVAMSVVLSCLLWGWMGWHFFGFWLAALMCVGEIALAYFYSRWLDRQMR